MADMKLHELIAEINFQEKQVSDLSGEEHANLLLDVLEVLMGYVDAEVDANPNNFQIQEFYKTRGAIYSSLTAISNLIANAPYSKLQDTRIISKRNLEVLEEKFNQTQMMFDRLKDCSIATEMRIQKTKIALEQVNERLQ
jgi:hypothetical protein